MLKLIVLLVALCASVVFADSHVVYLENNSGGRTSIEVPYYGGERWCYCLSQTQTNKIDGRSANDVKLFSSSDCTGNYASGTAKITYNAQWVNSVSFGASNKPSIEISYKCNWFA
ncbi:MAG: hypothetical protein J3R72DRAFT_475467 [Linnemannia gamsii]|nr:MAG: hypothetical protein J3R72DRAFT_475467 [Linnemannia gamsii]